MIDVSLNWEFYTLKSSSKLILLELTYTKFGALCYPTQNIVTVHYLLYILASFISFNQLARLKVIVNIYKK